MRALGRQCSREQTAFFVSFFTFLNLQWTASSTCSIQLGCRILCAMQEKYELWIFRMSEKNAHRWNGEWFMSSGSSAATWCNVHRWFGARIKNSSCDAVLAMHSSQSGIQGIEFLFHSFSCLHLTTSAAMLLLSRGHLDRFPLPTPL